MITFSLLLFLVISTSSDCAKTQIFTLNMNPARSDKNPEPLLPFSPPKDVSFSFTEDSEAYLTSRKFQLCCDKQNRSPRSPATRMSPSFSPTSPKKTTVMTVSTVNYNLQAKEPTTPVREGSDYYDAALDNFYISTSLLQPMKEFILHYDDAVINWDSESRQKQLVFSTRVSLNDFNMYMLKRVFNLIIQTTEHTHYISRRLDLPIALEKRPKIAHDFDGISFMYVPEDGVVESGEFEVVIFTRLEDKSSAAFQKFEEVIETINASLGFDFEPDFTFAVARNRRALLSRRNRINIRALTQRSKWKQTVIYPFMMPLIGAKSFFKAERDAQLQAKQFSGNLQKVNIQLANEAEVKLQNERIKKEIKTAATVLTKPTSAPPKTPPLLKKNPSFDAFSAENGFDFSNLQQAKPEPKKSKQTRRKPVIEKSTESAGPLSRPRMARQQVQAIPKPPSIQNPHFPQDGPFPSSFMSRVFPTLEDFVECLDSVTALQQKPDTSSASPIKKAAEVATTTQEISPPSVVDIA